MPVADEILIWARRDFDIGLDLAVGWGRIHLYSLLGEAQRARPAVNITCCLVRQHCIRQRFQSKTGSGHRRSQKVAPLCPINNHLCRCEMGGGACPGCSRLLAHGSHDAACSSC